MNNVVDKDTHCFVIFFLSLLRDGWQGGLENQSDEPLEPRTHSGDRESVLKGCVLTSVCSPALSHNKHRVNLKRPPFLNYM